MDKLKTINIKGKNYVQVNERVRAFREHYSEYSLETELIAVDSDTALMRAVIRTPDGRIVATGTAFERKDNTASMVNKTSHVENCETSAWGRALANFGIGIDESIASAQEVANAVLNKNAPEPKKVRKTPAQIQEDVATATAPLKTPATPEQLERLKQLCAETQTDKVKLCNENGVVNNFISTVTADTMIQMLEKKLSAKLDAL